MDGAAVSAPSDDRRTEQRVIANGEVRFRQTNVPGVSFSGRLVDIAKSGFRACHDRLELQSGEMVDFEFEGRRGVARAMWTRISKTLIESGFRICEEEPKKGRKNRGPAAA